MNKFSDYLELVVQIEQFIFREQKEVKLRHHRLQIRIHQSNLIAKSLIAKLNQSQLTKVTHHRIQKSPTRRKKVNCRRLTARL